MNYRDAMSSATMLDHGDESWNSFSDSYHESLGRLEEMIDDISDLKQVCRDEWCEAAECMLDEASVAAFAISEPHWESKEDSRRLRDLKRKIHDLYKSGESVH